MHNAHERLLQGRRYQKAGALDRAIEEFEVVADESRDPAVVAEALRYLSSTFRTRCDWDEAIEAAHRSASVARGAGMSGLVAEALNAEAAVHQSRGDFPQAVRLLEEMLDTTDDVRVHGIALQNLGSIAAMEGDYVHAEERFLNSYRCFSRAGYREGEATALNNWGRLMLLRGDFGAAEPICRRAVDAAREIEDLGLLAIASLNYAEALAGREEYSRAEDVASGVLGHFTTEDNAWRRVEALRLLGDLRQKQKDRETAIRFYRRGLELAHEIGARVEAEELTERIAALENAETGATDRTSTPSRSPDDGRST